MTDIMDPLSKKALKTFTDQVLEPLQWNATPEGIDISHGRGYSKQSVVSGMVNDLLADELAGGVHALSIDARAPGE